MSEIVIQPEELKKIINKNNLKIFDCRFNLLKKELGYESYLKSHIQNAHYVNLEKELSSVVTKHSGRHPLPDINDFSNFLNNQGINNSSRIVIYDEENNSMSARLWWMLKLVGIKNCSVLDGGFKAWNSLDLPVSSSIPIPSLSEKNKYSYNEESLVSTDNLMQLINDESHLLIDARENIRFLGKKEPIDKKGGHIPGAINMPFKNNLDENGKFKKKSDLLEMFQNLNQTNVAQIINMCGSGVTACHNYLAMEYCGFGISKLYVGSWSAWISHDENEIARE